MRFCLKPWFLQKFLTILFFFVNFKNIPNHFWIVFFCRIILTYCWCWFFSVAYLSLFARLLFLKLWLANCLVISTNALFKIILFVLLFVFLLFITLFPLQQICLLEMMFVFFGIFCCLRSVFADFTRVVSAVLWKESHSCWVVWVTNHYWVVNNRSNFIYEVWAK